MMYYVSITETLNKIVGVEAESEKEAEKIVYDAYYDSEIVLSSEDYISSEVELESEAQELYRGYDKDQDFYEHYTRS